MKTIIDNNVTTKQKDIIQEHINTQFDPIDVKLMRIEQKEANRWELTFSTRKDWLVDTIIHFIENCYFKAEYSK